MKKFKTKTGMTAAACQGRGSLMLSTENEIKDVNGTVDFSYSTHDQFKDQILIGMTFNHIGILTEVNSDHIAIMKEIIKKYEGGFKK